MKKLLTLLMSLALLGSVVFGTAVPKAAAAPLNAPARTSIVVLHPDGSEDATPNAREARPALSLSKLYLGYWVLRNGSPGDRALVEPMIRTSSDPIASQLDARYPQAIGEVAREFGLASTSRNGYWGNSSTSAYDVARFLRAIYGRADAASLFQGMHNAAPIAADGYPQNFGTSQLPGMRGTKFGWSDDRTIHASVSYTTGRQFIAAITYGGAATHTTDVVSHVHVAPPAPAVPVAPGVPAAPAPGSSALPAIAGLPVNSSLPALPAFPDVPAAPQVPSLADLSSPPALPALPALPTLPAFG